MKKAVVLTLFVGWIAIASVSRAAESNAENYLLHCSGCHGADGRGVPGVTPSLHGIAELLERPGGRAYLGRVPGVAQAALDDRKLAALLNWVLTEFSQHSADPPYSGKEMHRLRKNPLRDTVSGRPTQASTKE